MLVSMCVSMLFELLQTKPCRIIWKSCKQINSRPSTWQIWKIYMSVSVIASVVHQIRWFLNLWIPYLLGSDALCRRNELNMNDLEPIHTFFLWIKILDGMTCPRRQFLTEWIIVLFRFSAIMSFLFCHIYVTFFTNPWFLSDSFYHILSYHGFSTQIHNSSN